jgi:concanavalin A-like lectin/glucanase superfamily protein/parallel beta helix pectate lyase-like protein/FG-GAP repeat protein
MKRTSLISLNFLFVMICVLFVSAMSSLHASDLLYEDWESDTIDPTVWSTAQGALTDIGGEHGIVFRLYGISTWNPLLSFYYELPDYYAQVAKVKLSMDIKHISTLAGYFKTRLYGTSYSEYSDQVVSTNYYDWGHYEYVFSVVPPDTDVSLQILGYNQYWYVDNIRLSLIGLDIDAGPEQAPACFESNPTMYQLDDATVSCEGFAECGNYDYLWTVIQDNGTSVEFSSNFIRDPQVTLHGEGDCTLRLHTELAGSDPLISGEDDIQLFVRLFDVDAGTYPAVEWMDDDSVSVLLNGAFSYSAEIEGVDIEWSVQNRTSGYTFTGPTDKAVSSIDLHDEGLYVLKLHATGVDLGTELVFEKEDIVHLYVAREDSNGNDVPDSIEGCYELVTNTFAEVGTVQTWQADDKTWNYTLPFTFEMYNRLYSEVQISSNGFIELGQRDSDLIAYDSAGTNDGTPSSPPPTWTTGRINGALDFNGTDNYVEAVGYKGVTGTNSRTCSAWVKTSHADAVILSWGDENVDGARWLLKTDATGALRVSVGDGYIKGSKTINDGVWHHVAAVFAEDASPYVTDIKLYVDGDIETITYDQRLITQGNENADVLIGAFYGGSYFEGLIDDVRVYSSALSGDDIQLLFERTEPLTSPDAHWKLDGPGDPAPDNSMWDLWINEDNTPRIAPLWDDLTTVGGDIFIDEQTPGQVTIRWQAFDASTGTQPRNFSATLNDSGAISFDYGTVIAGVTPTVGTSSGDGQFCDLILDGYTSDDVPINLIAADTVLCGMFGPDKNANLKVDVCEPDCNGNNVPDSFDLHTAQTLLEDINGGTHGYSVAISNDGKLAAIGIPFASGGGEVNLYSYNDITQTWDPYGTLQPFGGISEGDLYGCSLAMTISQSGEPVIVVGAKGTDVIFDDVFYQDAGAVYIFHLGHVIGENGYRIEAPSLCLAANDAFGTTVAVSANGKAVAVGAPLAGSSSGSVYMFYNNEEHPHIDWTDGSRITGPAPIEGTEFGRSMALSEYGDLLLVGRPSTDDTYPGEVYLYENETMQMTLSEVQNKYEQNIALQDHDNFGCAVDISADGSMIVVGASKYTTSADWQESGAVFIFQNDDGWSWKEMLQPIRRNSFDHFGHSLAISEYATTLVVGAPDDDFDDSTQDSGAAYVYYYNGYTDSWQWASKLLRMDGVAPVPVASYYLGHSVDIVGNTPIVGAFGQTAQNRSVWVYNSKDCNRNRIPEDEGVDCDDPENPIEITSLTGDVTDLSTHGGGQITFEGSGFTWPVIVTFYSQEHQVILKDEDVFVSGDGTELTVNVPPFAPGTKAAVMDTLDVNVRISNECASVDLFDKTGNVLEYTIEKTIIGPTKSYSVDIQDTVDKALPGTCIILKQGHNYTIKPDEEDNNRTLDFINKSRITLTGADLSDPSRTKISGPYKDSTSGNDPVINIANTASGTGDGISIVGLNIRCGAPGINITGAYARPIIKHCFIDDNFNGAVKVSEGAKPVITHCIMEYNETKNSGGGISIDGASGSILHCGIIGNYAKTSGGGIYLNNTTADLLIAHNIISRNISPENDFPLTPTNDYPIDGGGIYIGGTSQGVILKNEILDNMVTGNGAGIYVTKDAAPQIVGNDIIKNLGETSSSHGGGIYVEDYNTQGFPVCQNVIAENEAQIGGAFYAKTKNNTRITYNLIYGNRVFQKCIGTACNNNPPYYAAGIYVVDSDPWICFNTIAQNTGGWYEKEINNITYHPDTSGGIMGHDLGAQGALTHTKIVGNILYNNSGPNAHYQLYLGPISDNFRGEIDYNLAYGGSTYYDLPEVAHNIEGDPCFVGGASEDPWVRYDLLAGSDAIGHYNGCDIGAVQDPLMPNCLPDCLPTPSVDNNENGIADHVDLITDKWQDNNWDGVLEPFEAEYSEIEEDPMVSVLDYDIDNSHTEKLLAAIHIYFLSSYEDGTTGGENITAYGTGFENLTSIKFVSNWYSSTIQKDDLEIISDTEVKFYVPPFTPPKDSPDRESFYVNIMFSDGTGWVGLKAQTGNFFEYNIEKITLSVGYEDLLQDVVDFAPPGTCIVLAPSNYLLTEPLSFKEEHSCITLVSEYPYGAILYQLTESKACISFDSTGPGICLSGLLIRLGDPGINISNSDPYIYDCVLENNDTAAINIVGTDVFNQARATIDYCFCQRNTGPGIIVVDASPVLISNDLFDNTKGINISGTSEGTIIYRNIIEANSNGGIYWNSEDSMIARGVISGNTIKGNTASNGAGIYIGKNGNPLITENLIEANTATAQGGGLYVASWNLNNFLVRGNIFTANSANIGGAVVFNRKNEVNFQSNIIMNNTADEKAPGIYILDAIPHILHNTIYHNTSSAGETGGIHGEHILAGTKIKNNIVSHNDGYQIYCKHEVTEENVLQYNLVYKAGKTFEECIHPHFVAAHEAPDNGYNILGDPLFDDPADEDPWTGFELGAGSAAEDNAEEGRDCGAIQPALGPQLPLYIPWKLSDTNYNGVADTAEILAGYETDENINLIPDSVEIHNEIRNMTRNTVHTGTDSLQQAIDQAGDGDIIQISPGYYNQYCIITPRSIMLTGIMPTNWSVVDQTMISSPQWQYGSAIYFSTESSLLGPRYSAFVRGLRFIVQYNFSAIGLDHSYVDNTMEKFVIENCIFNMVGNDHNVYGITGETNEADVVIRNCAATGNNFSWQEWLHLNNRGGALSDLYVDNCSVYRTRVAMSIMSFKDLLIEDIYVAENTSDTEPTLCTFYSIQSFAVRCSTFESNVSSSLFKLYNIVGKFDSCKFISNTATYAGAISAVYSNNIAIENTVFDRNHLIDNGAPMSKKGGAIKIDHGNNVMNIRHCTFFGNEAVLEGQCGGAIHNQGDLTVSGSIFWGNRNFGAEPILDQQIYNDGGTLNVTYSTLEDDLEDGSHPYGEQTNIDSDPLFIDSSIGDLRLYYEHGSPSSPCIDYAPDLGVDHDIRGAERPVDFIEDYVVYGNYDLGAYEMEADVDFPNFIMGGFAMAGTPGSIVMNFTYPVTIESAEDPNNYAVDRYVILTEAPQLLDNGSSVRLQTSPLTLGEPYTVSVNGVVSLLGAVTDDRTTLQTTDDVSDCDFNGDLQLDVQDITYLAADWLLPSAVADVAPAPSGDGIVDLLDFAKFAECWIDK